MTQKSIEKFDMIQSTDTSQERFEALLALEPKLVTNTVPDNAAEAKNAFIEGDEERPVHTYSKLATVDVDTLRKIAEAEDFFATSDTIRDKDKVVYADFIAAYRSRIHLMSLMHEARSGYDGADEEFMKLNIELYGEPDSDVYLSLLQEKVTSYADKQLSPGHERLLDELHELLPEEAFDAKHEVKRFTPSPETVEWMQQVTESLYGPWLERMPADKATYTEQEVAELFTQVLREDIGEAAEGWRVDVEPAKAINVKTAEKRIVIPDNRGELSQAMVKKLLVHEVGVHVLRSLAGESTDLGPLRTGLNEYYEAEEGLGKVMEQAVSGKFSESGNDHYVTAGLAYYGHKNFREVFEAKWRLAALTSAKPGEELTEEAVQKAKDTAYGATMRIMRGTDSLPWFKDLAYYNGSVDVWKYLEEIRGDDQQLSLLLLGKVNTSKRHQQVMLESHSL